MHLPVLALVPGGQKRLGRDVRIVPVLVGIVLQRKPKLAFVLFQNPLDDRTGRLAVRSLKVQELDDRDRSIHRSQDRAIPQGNIVTFLVRRG